MTDHQPPADTLSKGAKRLIAFNILLHLISGLLLGAWLVHMYAPEGDISGGDLSKVILMTIGVMAALSACTIMAIRLIPEVKGGARMILSVFVALFMGLSALFGGGASASMMGLKSAERAYEQQAVGTMTASPENSKDLVDQVNDLIPTLHRCDVVVSDMLRREVEAGAISMTGSNFGPVSAELSAIQLACQTAQRSLVASRSQTSALFADMDRIVAQARRTADDDSLTDRVKLHRLVRASEELGKLGKELATVVPVQSLRPLADTLKKDREVLGLSPEAVAKIDSELRPLAKAIGANVEEIAENLQRPYPTFTLVENPMEYLWLFPGTMIVPIVIAVLLEATPLLVILFCVVLALQRQRERGDGEPGSGGGNVLTIKPARATA